MRLLGAILAGGQSQRFGSDKAVALLDGKPLIDHAADTLGRWVADIVVCGRDVARSDLTSIADWPRAGLGPLGGLCGALRHARDHGHDAVITVGCDTPVIADDIMQRLLSLTGAGYITDVPIIGRWPATLAEALSLRLSGDGDRSVYRWAADIGAEAIAAPHVENINRPADLAKLERSLRE